MKKFTLLTLIIFTSYLGFSQGETCLNPIVVNSLPYNTTDDTSNYGDDYDTADRPALGGEQYTSGTGSASYLTGDDAVYAFTPTSNGVYTFNLSNTLNDWIGFWLFEGCNPFTSIVARHTATSGTTRTLPNLNLIAGTTYYVVISSWPAPQSTPYTLDITQITCPNPSSLGVSNVTVNSTDLGWTENGSATTWDIEWGLSGFTQTGTPNLEDVNDNPYTLGGLDADTAYQFYVRADCGGGDTSSWVGPFSFTTVPTCPSPSSLTVSNLTSSSADLGWTENGTATTWDIEWGLNGFTQTGTPNLEDVTDNPYTLGGLDADTAYQFYIRADCGGGDTSSWIGPFSFFTGYCVPSGTNTSTYIDSFTTSGAPSNINNTSTGLSTNNYADYYDTLSVTSFADGAFDFTVSIVSGTVGCAVWVDWNNDLVFDTSEVEFSTTSYGNGPFTSSVTIPSSTANGEYRMRVMIDWNDSNPGDDGACGFTSGRGEVEDYKIIVSDPPTDSLDYFNLQWPASGTITYGDAYVVYAQCYEAGLTDVTSGQAPGILCWVGYSSTDTDPSGAGWNWVAATFNVEVGNNDEYMLDLAAEIDTLGGYPYYYATRWSLNGGPYTYGGIQSDGSYGGQWGNDNNISGTLTINPIVPNDICSGAIALTVGVNYLDNSVDSSVVGATNDAEPISCGSNGPGVWYSAVVPVDGNIIIETGPDSNNITGFDSVIEVFSGSCGSLTSIDCDDDGAATGNYSLLQITGLTPGETIYIRVWEYGGNEEEPFSISVYNPSLSVEENSVLDLFSYFPNPVENTLNIKSQKNIESVIVYDILGQQVMSISPNAFTNELDMTKLTTGSYFVQVTTEGISKTVRIVKQ